MNDSRQCDLHGLGVLITRPRHQAQPLFDAIKKCGGKPVLFPTIEITASANSSKSKQQLQNAAEYDDLIFVSPNAVNYAIADVTINHQRVFAIGGATGKKLEIYNIKHYLPCGKKADSESLLASPMLDDMQGRYVLIIRGNGGRTMLGETLNRRGAVVDYAEVYQRRCPDIDTTYLLQKWPQEIDIVITTSNSTIDNFLRLFQYNQIILRTPLVVISQRMQKHAKRLGFKKIIIADGVTENDLLYTLCDFITTSYVSSTHQ